MLLLGRERTYLICLGERPQQLDGDSRFFPMRDYIARRSLLNREILGALRVVEGDYVNLNNEVRIKVVP